jgi:hypothetical protein
LRVSKVSAPAGPTQRRRLPNIGLFEAQPMARGKARAVVQGSRALQVPVRFA